MDVKNVFIIVGKEYTKESIVEIIKEEGYQDNFVFGTSFTREVRSDWENIMRDCDEVWQFGTCHQDNEERRFQLEFAIREKLDLWQMG